MKPYELERYFKAVLKHLENKRIRNLLSRIEAETNKTVKTVKKGIGPPIQEKIDKNEKQGQAPA